jgi:hypothetical protein
MTPSFLSLEASDDYRGAGSACQDERGGRQDSTASEELNLSTSGLGMSIEHQTHDPPAR